MIDTPLGGATPRDRGMLTITGGPAAGLVVPLRGVADITIGRSPDCAVSIADSSLSRVHARLVHVGSTFVLKDAGSKNGTFVDGRSAAQALALTDGARIQLSSLTTLRFALVDAKEEEAMARAYEATLRDGLTGLYNRRHLDRLLEAEVAAYIRERRPTSVAMLDIDHFKRVNDTHGHAAGDAVLRTYATTVAALLRPDDLFARYGGEEFTIVLRDRTGPEAVAFADWLRAAVEQTPIAFGSVVLRVTSSFGVAAFDECHPLDKDTPVRLADERLYRAKQSGRNRVVGA